MTSGGGANRAANLTAGIAVAMLFSLCNPWSGRGQVKKNKLHTLRSRVFRPDPHSVRFVKFVHIF